MVFISTKLAPNGHYIQLCSFWLAPIIFEESKLKSKVIRFLCEICRKNKAGQNENNKSIDPNVTEKGAKLRIVAGPMGFEPMTFSLEG